MRINFVQLSLHLTVSELSFPQNSVPKVKTSKISSHIERKYLRVYHFSLHHHFHVVPIRFVTQSTSSRNPIKRNIKNRLTASFAPSSDSRFHCHRQCCKNISGHICRMFPLSLMCDKGTEKLSFLCLLRCRYAFEFCCRGKYADEN